MASLFLLFPALVSIVVVSIVVAGAYPLLVKGFLSNTPISISEAFRKALGRFWSLLGAGVLAGLMIALGTLALVVPGVILATWYFYTVSAVMLEDKGAIPGMRASKVFGRDKKWSTFLILLAILLVGSIVGVLQVVTSVFSPLIGMIVGFIFGIPFGAWVSVIPAYVYLVYGPSLGEGEAGSGSS